MHYTLSMHFTLPMHYTPTMHYTLSMHFTLTLHYTLSIHCVLVSIQYGNILVLDTNTSRIQVFSAEGEHTTALAACTAALAAARTAARAKEAMEIPPQHPLKCL
jgi:hypothetical protein